jgi:hypothetical protein
VGASELARVDARVGGSGEVPQWRSAVLGHSTTLGPSRECVSAALTIVSVCAGKRERRLRSLVAQLLPPVARTTFRGEIEEIPERLEGADVPRLLTAVRWRVEEL